LAWYEFDLNWYVIVVLRIFGLAWSVKARNLDADREKERAVFQIAA
jgi:fatty-acid desaturase